jgi:RNA-directed DNA polymerase
MNENTKLFLKCTSREQLASVLGIPLATLTYLAYAEGKKYTKFSIKKKDGSDRVIHAPTIALKRVQVRLKIFFEEIYHAPSSTYGFIKEKDAIKNAEQHLRKKSVLNFDLKDFFPSINSGRILGLLQSRPFNFNREIASTITGLVCHENFLPQGAPTSPVLSNLIAFNLDRKFIQIAKADRLTYTRYADDITISSTSNVLPDGYLKSMAGAYECDERILSVVENNGFSINSKKTRFHSRNKPHYVTGVKVNIKPNVSWKFIRQIRAMLHAWETFGPDAAEHHFNQKYNHSFPKNFSNVLRGKIEYIRHVKSDLDVTYRKLYNKYIELEGLGGGILPISEVEALYEKIQIIKSNSGIGSGFVLNDNYLITCAHTVENELLGDEISFFNYNEFSSTTSRKGLLVYKNSKQDIAIIDPTSKRDLSRLSFSDGFIGLDFKILTEFIAIGFPWYKAGNPPHFSVVSVAASNINQHGVKEIYVDRPLFSGMSGGVILDSKSKKICGMISRGVGSVRDVDQTPGNIFIPMYYIKKAIAEHEDSHPGHALLATR